MKRSDEGKKENAALKGKNPQDSDHRALCSTSFCLQGEQGERFGHDRNPFLVSSFFAEQSLAPFSRRQGTLALQTLDYPFRVALS